MLLFWVAVKELKLSYYIGETLLFTIYTHYGNLISQFCGVLEVLSTECSQARPEVRLSFSGACFWGSTPGAQASTLFTG